MASNIWTKVFKGSRDIKGSSAVNGQRSKVFFCTQNLKGYSTISSTLTAALLNVIKEDVCAYYTDTDTLVCECTGSTGNLYVVEYDTKAGKMHTVCFDPSKKMEKRDLAADYIHWSLFVPIIITLIENQSTEFVDAFNILKGEYIYAGSLKASSALYVTNDYLYQIRNNYSVMDSDVVTLDDSPTYEIKKKCDIGKNDPVVGIPALKKKMPNPVKKNQKKNNYDEFKLPLSKKLTAAQKKLVPNLDLDSIQISADILHVLGLIKHRINSKNPIRNIFLYGEAGAGKTTGCEVISQLLGIPRYSTNFSFGTEDSEIIGTYKPKEDGTFEYCLSPFARAFKYGGVIELAEINFARPGSIGKINSALDRVQMLTLDNGETVKRHENCIIIITANVDYAGCKEINFSLKSRFSQMIRVEKLSKRQLIEVIASESGLSDRNVLGKIYDISALIMKKIEEDQIDGEVSTRQMIDWASDYEFSGDLYAAAKRTILPGVSLLDDVQKEIEETIIKNII